MAAAQMFSITSSLHSTSLTLRQFQSPPLCTFCGPLSRKGLLLKSENSNLFQTSTSFKFGKPYHVFFRPRRGYQPVFMNLPTANPEWTAAEKTPKWSERAIRSFSIGEAETREMRYPSIDTAALLMGVMIEVTPPFPGTSPAAKFLRANGVTVFKVREETYKLKGVHQKWEASPVDIPESEDAVKALDWAVEEKLKSGETGEVTPTHMVLGIWAQKGSTGQNILANLGFDDKKAEELANSVKSEDQNKRY